VGVGSQETLAPHPQRSAAPDRVATLARAWAIWRPSHGLATVATKQGDSLAIHRGFPLVQSRPLHLLIERVDFDGRTGDISMTFHPTGIKTLADELAEKMIRDGEVRDYADLARLGHVTRARLTQIMNLLNLAPDIQEAILFLPAVTTGDDPIHERQLRPIVKVLDWGKQRKMWAEDGVEACMGFGSASAYGVTVVKGLTTVTPS